MSSKRMLIEVRSVKAIEQALTTSQEGAEQTTTSPANKASGELAFYLRRVGEGSYWADGSFSAALFEDMSVLLKWNPLGAHLSLSGRTRRFNHPIPSQGTRTKITTQVLLFDASGNEIAPGISLTLHEGPSDDVSDTGLRALDVQSALGKPSVNYSLLASISILGEILVPAQPPKS